MCNLVRPFLKVKKKKKKRFEDTVQLKNICLVCLMPLVQTPVLEEKIENKKNKKEVSYKQNKKMTKENGGQIGRHYKHIPSQKKAQTDLRLNSTETISKCLQAAAPSAFQNAPTGFLVFILQLSEPNCHFRQKRK